MSKRSSGNAFQDWTAKWLLKTFPGCAVHNQKSVSTQVNIPGKGHVWVSKRNDIFGCVDLVAVKANMKVLFVQCTLDSSLGRKFKELALVPWNPSVSNVCVFQKKGPRRVVIFYMMDDGTFQKVAEILGGKLVQADLQPSQSEPTNGSQDSN